MLYVLVTKDPPVKSLKGLFHKTMILATFWQMTKGLFLYFVGGRCGVFGVLQYSDELSHKMAFNYSKI